MKKLLIIAGPTASGKTSLSIQCAKYFDGEIISADSMQVYKYLDVGTAKITEEERCGIPHHLLDIVSPLENFNTYDYRQLALSKIDDITKRGKTPIIVGGTGLYIDSILYNMSFLSRDVTLRDELNREAEEKGVEYMYAKLAEIDPEAHARLHVNDIRRVVRAIEVALCGKNNKDDLQQAVFPYTMAVLEGDREILYNRINERVDKMFANGLEKEVDYLLSMGVTRENTCMQAIAYKELLAYKNGEYDIDRCVELIKQRSRHYAKRQITWFKKYNDAVRINFLDIENEFNKIIENYGE